MSPARSRLLSGALLGAALLMAGTGPGSANNGNNGAAIAAGITGLAVGTMIGAAVATPRDPVIYGPPPPYYPPPPGYRPPPPPPGYRPPPPPPPVGAPFSPARNIMCYPARRTCMNTALGGYSGDWTYRVFGR